MPENIRFKHFDVWADYIVQQFHISNIFRNKEICVLYFSYLKNLYIHITYINLWIIVCVVGGGGGGGGGGGMLCVFACILLKCVTYSRIVRRYTIRFPRISIEYTLVKVAMYMSYHLSILTISQYAREYTFQALRCLSRFHCATISHFKRIS